MLAILSFGQDSESLGWTLLSFGKDPESLGWAPVTFGLSHCAGNDTKNRLNHFERGLMNSLAYTRDP